MPTESPFFNLNFSYAFGEPEYSAEFRARPCDFQVAENLGFSPCGEGEHLFVQIEKEGENTQWVADKLAQYFSIKSKDVGFCGLKDRHAITSQWFSLYLPKLSSTPDWDEFIANSELKAKVLASEKHNKKLRRGEHESNRFKIRLRNILNNESNRERIEERLESIQKSGVPNYFGEQRFGREGNNLSMVHEWVEAKYKIKNSKKRNIIYSSARSYIFNSVLSQRVLDQTWNTLLEGDDEIEGLATAPLWGRGRSSTAAAAAEVEAATLESIRTWCDALEHVGLNQERRSLVLRPEDLNLEFIGNDLELSFALAPGQYATSVLREICQLKNLAAL